MEAPHWICRVMNCISDPAWWDGVIVGLAVGVLPLFVWLWMTGN